MFRLEVDFLVNLTEILAQNQKKNTFLLCIKEIKLIFQQLRFFAL